MNKNKNTDISIQDLDNLLNANEEGKINLLDEEVKLIEKLKNGDSSAEKYKCIIEHSIKTLKNQNSLEEKLEKEFKDFYNKTKAKSPDEIMQCAYEITVKEEIKNNLKDMDLYPIEVKALLKQNDILNEFYHDWLNVDTPLGEVLENSIEESISMVTKYYKSKGKER